MSMNKKYLLIVPAIVLALLARVFYERAVKGENSSAVSVAYDAVGLSSKGRALVATAPAMPEFTAAGGAPSAGRAYNDASVAESVGKIVPPRPAPAADVPADKRIIIQTSNISLVVKNVSSTLDIIADLATKSGGYVVEKNFYKAGISPTGYISVRLPAKGLQLGLEELRRLGEVVSENAQGTDVTAEYVDLTSQLRNLRAAETQLLEIIKRSGTIAEVLQVQNELTNVRGQIESLQGRTKYLEQSAAFSLVTVQLATDQGELPIINKTGEQWKPLATFKIALHSLIDLGKGLVDALIWLVVYVPLWIIIGVIVWLVSRKIWRMVTMKKM